MQNYKLIVSDLDGTLLDSDMTLSKKNCDAIERLSEMGIKFVPSSGRTLYQIPSYIRENPSFRYIIYSNGTAIHDKRLGRDIASNYISQSAANAALDILSEYDVFIVTHSDGYAVADVKTTEGDYAYYQMNDYYKAIFKKANQADDIRLFTRKSTTVESIVIFFHSDDELAECYERFKKIDGITITSSIVHNLELCSDKAGKGAALATLAGLLEIPKEEIIAIGDNTNDTSMFTEAGLALCVSNGRDDAKALADRVICSNNEAVADYILSNIIK